MAWLISIICIVIVVYFWRIFLPLGVVAVILIVGFLLYLEYQSNQRKKAELQADQELRLKISNAQRNATSEGKEWKVLGEPDPASGIKIARTALIRSNDGLCYLSVQKRINGSELTGLQCPEIKISNYEDIYVKFDTDETSKKMDLEAYSNSENVFIPSYQSEYSGYLSYQDFMKGIVTANTVAIKIPGANDFWTSFTLKDSTVAINQLGKEMESYQNINASDAKNRSAD